MKQNDFYRAFEDRHRGSREEIKKRQQFYLPFVVHLKDIYPNGKVLDIGCGRGEWLEILQEFDIDATGIDRDKGMLKVAKKHNLKVIETDGIEYLKSLPNESLMAISAFQVVEHISFDDIQLLVSEALRVLKPAGLLILETPNPENIRVSSEYFYLDPTHLKPLPSGLMSFVLEYYGFARVKQLRLQEKESLINQEEATIREVLEGVSPDYTIIGQKEADVSILKKFDGLFDKNYGVSMDMVYDKFSKTIQRLDSTIKLVENHTTRLDNTLKDTAIHISDMRQQILLLETDIKQNMDNSLKYFNHIEEKFTESYSQIAKLENMVIEAEMRYTELLNSNSWKLTYPLRKTRQAFRWFYTGVYHWVTFSPTSRPRRVVKSILFKLKVFVNRYPKVKGKLVAILDNFPKLKLKLKNIQPNIKVNNNFIDKYTYRTDNTNQNKLSIDEILSRIQKEVELKEEDK